jgi:hypothetical protein
MFAVDVSPKRLGVADEIHFGKFFENGMEPVKSAIVISVFKVKQHRDLEFPGQFRDSFDVS